MIVALLYNHLSTYELAKKSGIARTTIYQWIRTFEAEN
nr:helix-turn-helix domain-containing protein [Alistipes sp.]